MTDDFTSYINKFMQDIVQSKDLIDDKYIKKLLENWSIKYFRYDENHNVTNPDAIDGLNKVFIKISKTTTVNNINTIMGINQIMSNKVATDHVLGNSLFLCKFCFALHHFFVRRNKDNSDIKKVLCTLSASMLENIRGFIYSYMMDDFLTVIQKVRIIYECYVIFLFIDGHKELAEPFLEHIETIKGKLFTDLSTGSVIKQKNLNLDNEYLGWTKTILSDKAKRKLSFLAEDVGIPKEMSLIYNLSSNFIHTNAYSAFMKSAISKDFLQTFLPFITDIMIRQTVKLLENINDVKYQNEFIAVLLNTFQNYSIDLASDAFKPD
jgi:hypothetical protein